MVLDLFLGDVAGLIARGILIRERAISWVTDLADVLVLEAVERIQVKITLPNGKEVALDYEVSDDGRISSGAGCGGISSHWIPSNASVGLVIRWRIHAPKYAEAQRLLQGRGWTTGTMLDASGAPERAFAKDGYGFYRRIVGEWQT